MASHSPTGEPKDEARPYLLGWAALTRMMTRGVSWSGNERNVCYLNLGDGRFVDVSYPSGLDFLDDGRAVAAVDWDADGDLDLWLRNRTGPQLRFMLNRGTPRRNSVSILLAGKTSNRDAIGARVELRSGERTIVRTVTAGDGYLAQSSKALHFGLGGESRVDGLVVHWPGGTSETVRGLEAGGRYRIVQGSGEAERLKPRAVALAAAPAPSFGPDPLTPVLLKVPLPMPPTMQGLAPAAPGKARLLNLWAHWCEPCMEELAGFAEAYAELQDAGIEVVALSVDPADQRQAAEKTFATRIAPGMTGSGFSPRFATPEQMETVDAILEHVLRRRDELLLPTSLLIDPSGRLQLVYLGPLGAERLAGDARRWALSEVGASKRTLYPGRWYFRTPRDLAGLASSLAERGREGDALFFRRRLQPR